MIEQKISIKPLSVNDAWKGKRFKTKEYQWYIEHLSYLLSSKDRREFKKTDKLKVNYEFGFSNRGSDWDNPIKPLGDILQAKYNFNDNRIYQGFVQKEIVKKGDEYISFQIDLFDSSRKCPHCGRC